jgi:hypothetical protein
MFICNSAFLVFHEIGTFYTCSTWIRNTYRYRMRILTFIKYLNESQKNLKIFDG